MNRFAPIGLAALATLSIAACSDDDDNAAAEAVLRIFHASPDAPAVNVWLDGSPALEGVDYQASSGQIRVAAGSHTVQIDAILADDTTLTVLPETTLDLAENMEYNVLAMGRAAEIGSGNDTEFGPQIVARDYLMPEGARVQAIHASPDAPTVDVFITAPGADLSGEMPFADDLAYTMYSDAVEVPAGDYQIRITDMSDSSIVYFDSGTVSVPAGGDWVAAAVTNTDAGGSPVSLVVDTGAASLVVQSADSTANLRVVHTISDAPGVDIWVNGTAPDASSPLFNLMYKEFTDYLALDVSMSYDFAVGVNGSDPVVVVDALGLSDVMLDANTSYSAIAIGNLGDMLDNDETYVVVDANTRRVATEAKVRAIHASTLAGNVDIYISEDATPSMDDIILEGVAYKGDSTVLSITPGARYVMVTPAGDDSVIAIGPVEFPFAGNTLTTIIALDDPMSATGVSAISIDD